LRVILNLNFQPLGSPSPCFLGCVLLFPGDFGNLRLRRETVYLVSAVLVNSNVGKSFLALFFHLRTGLGGLLGLWAVDDSILILNFLS
jgi:hypothetical protein